MMIKSWLNYPILYSNPYIFVIAGYLQKVSAASKVALGGATTSEFLHTWLNFFDHIMNNHWFHQNHCAFLFPMMYLSSQSIQVESWSNLYLIQAFLLLKVGFILEQVLFVEKVNKNRALKFLKIRN